MEINGPICNKGSQYPGNSLFSQSIYFPGPHYVAGGDQWPPTPVPVTWSPLLSCSTLTRHRVMNGSPFPGRWHIVLLCIVYFFIFCHIYGIWVQQRNEAPLKIMKPWLKDKGWFIQLECKWKLQNLLLRLPEHWIPVKTAQLYFVECPFYTYLSNWRGGERKTVTTWACARSISTLSVKSCQIVKISAPTSRNIKA